MCTFLTRFRVSPCQTGGAQLASLGHEAVTHCPIPLFSAYPSDDPVEHLAVLGTEGAGGSPVPGALVLVGRKGESREGSLVGTWPGHRGQSVGMILPPVPCDLDHLTFLSGPQLSI